MRRSYRQMLITTPNLEDSISGVILYDETIHQKLDNELSFIEAVNKKGIIAGIKVDKGAKDLAVHEGEKVTERLDGLRDRLVQYAAMGLKFAKWRAVITIGNNIPSHACIESNAHALARYAALCQENNIVPIIEPEVLMNGSHTLEDCQKATEATLHSVFKHLYQQGVMLEGIILKPNMVVPGLDCSTQNSIEEVADATVKTLFRTVSAAVPGIAFLSGGQSAELATLRLNAMNQRFESKMPWELSFSFARAIQAPAMEAWLGNDKNIEVAQSKLLERASANKEARMRRYSS